jgi:hypothetical protein
MAPLGLTSQVPVTQKNSEMQTWIIELKFYWNAYLVLQEAKHTRELENRLDLLEFPDENMAIEILKLALAEGASQ